MENENKLPEEFKAKWCAALRSGEYKQGKQSLWDANDDSFCCIGVACVVAGKNKEDLHKATYVGVYEPEYEFEPFEGFPTILVHREHKDTATKLAEMNDGEAGRTYTFPEIADYIEQNL